MAIHTDDFWWRGEWEFEGRTHLSASLSLTTACCSLCQDVIQFIMGWAHRGCRTRDGRGLSDSQRGEQQWDNWIWNTSQRDIASRKVCNSHHLSFLWLTSARFDQLLPLSHSFFHLKIIIYFSWLEFQNSGLQARSLLSPYWREHKQCCGDFLPILFISCCWPKLLLYVVQNHLHAVINPICWFLLHKLNWITSDFFSLSTHCPSQQYIYGVNPLQHRDLLISVFSSVG